MRCCLLNEVQMNDANVNRAGPLKGRQMTCASSGSRAFLSHEQCTSIVMFTKGGLRLKVFLRRHLPNKLKGGKTKSGSLRSQRGVTRLGGKEHAKTWLT